VALPPLITHMAQGERDYVDETIEVGNHIMQKMTILNEEKKLLSHSKQKTEAQLVEANKLIHELNTKISNQSKEIKNMQHQIDKLKSDLDEERKITRMVARKRVSWKHLGAMSSGTRRLPWRQGRYGVSIFFVLFFFCFFLFFKNYFFIFFLLLLLRYLFLLYMECTLLIG
jgi:hypothetical protein